MLKFNPTTRIVFLRKISSYEIGSGQCVQWEEIGSLYCEWKSGFGERALSAQALGVASMATVRTFYHPEIYNCLNGDQALIVRNDSNDALKEDGTPDNNNPNVYELWGGVDNAGQLNQFMEFQVRRYQAK